MMLLPKPRYEALVFDLDGTLIDSAPDIAGAVNEVLERRGWPVQSVAFVEKFIGYGPRRLLLDLLVAVGLPSDDADGRRGGAGVPRQL